MTLSEAIDRVATLKQSLREAPNLPALDALAGSHRALVADLERNGETAAFAHQLRHLYRLRRRELR